MKNIKKTKNNLFLIALMMSILFVPGILMIIFGFINHIIFIGVIGIIIVVIDFYGLPIVWMRFGEYNYYYRLFYQITVELTTTIHRAIANNTASTLRPRLFVSFFARFFNILKPPSP